MSNARLTTTYSALPAARTAPALASLARPKASDATSPREMKPSTYPVRTRMTDYFVNYRGKRCANCGKPLGRLHVNLHRNEERHAKPDDATPLGNTLDVANAQVLKSYCMNCGTNAARTDLAKLGFTCRDTEDYANTFHCTSCQTAKLDLYGWHATYLVAVMKSDAGDPGVVDETVVVMACPKCEKKHGALRPGEPTKLAYLTR